MEKEAIKSLESILEEISELRERERIAALAHEFWLARGCPEGTAAEDWFLAERELSERKAAARAAILGQIRLSRTAHSLPISLQVRRVLFDFLEVGLPAFVFDILLFPFHAEILRRGDGDGILCFFEFLVHWLHNLILPPLSAAVRHWTK